MVSNLTRDWTQLALHISVAYSADSDQVIKLLNEVGRSWRRSRFFDDDRRQAGGAGHREGERRRGGLPDAGEDPAGEDKTMFRRELRRRIKASFEKNKIEPGNPNRVYVMDTAKPGLAVRRPRSAKIAIRPSLFARARTTRCHPERRRASVARRSRSPVGYQHSPTHLFTVIPTGAEGSVGCDPRKGQHLH